MGNRKDGYSRLAFRRVQNLLNVERFAFHPTAEAGRGEQIIERHRQLETIFRRGKRFDIHHANLRHWRRLNLLDQSRDIEIFTGRPLLTENVGNQNVLAAFERIGIDSKQTEQTGGRGVDALCQQLTRLL